MKSTPYCYIFAYLHEAFSVVDDCEIQGKPFPADKQLQSRPMLSRTLASNHIHLQGTFNIFLSELRYEVPNSRFQTFSMTKECKVV